VRNKEFAMNPIVLIPARMASTRLPGKPLADICGVPMIVRVWRQASKAGIGPVFVAAAEKEIAATVEAAGGKAVLTDPALPSGSDRIFAALKTVDGGSRYDAVVNLQGDLPTIDPECLRTAVGALADGDADIATLAAEIGESDPLADNPNAAKAVVAWAGEHGRALYFTRARAPAGKGSLWFHVGLYVYRREALAKFVGLSPSPLERREKLEQLRALEAGMRIAVAKVPAIPLSIDTPEDLALARARLAKENAS
jgi:3-deoxy-manno-octulosonate cytidylyltransferase (CMP-KDO synthetase)